MMLPQIPPGRAPVPATYRSRIEQRDAKIAELDRRGVVPSPPRAVYTASAITMTAQPAIGGSTSVVGGWTMTGGTDQGITVSNDSTGVSNGLLTLPAGLWRVDVFWNNSGGGYALTDSCDYWLAPDSGAQYFGTSFRPGNYTAASTSTGEVDVPNGGTLKITYYSTFAWTRNLTMSLRKVG